MSYNTLSLEKIAARINIKKRPISQPTIPQARPAPVAPMRPIPQAPPAPVAPMQPRPQAPVAPMQPRPPQQAVPVAPMYRPHQQAVPVAPMPPRTPQQTVHVAPMYRPTQANSYTLRTNTQFPYNYNGQYTLPTNPISQGAYSLPRIDGAQPGSYTLPLRPSVNTSKGWKWEDLIDHGADIVEFVPYLWDNDNDEDDPYVPSRMISRRRK